MPNTKVILYRDDDGSVPIIDWLEEISKKARAKCLARLERLSEHGHELRRPEADLLRDGIDELRVGLKEQNYRMLSFFHGQVVAVVSPGLLKEQVVPVKEIDLAVERRRHLKQTRNGTRTRQEKKMTKAKKAPKMAAKKTTAGIQILRNRFVKSDAQLARLVQEEKANMAVAQKICDLRNEAGISQRELARLVGTTASSICRLEDADYDGHSLSMLHRIAAALDRRIDIQFVPLKEARQYA